MGNSDHGTTYMRVLMKPPNPPPPGAYTGGLLGVVMHPLGLPSGTLPFCIGTLLFALLQANHTTLLKC